MILLITDCVVTGYPRLHFGLVDLSGVTDRVYGGVGVSFRGIPTVVRARPSNELRVEPANLSDNLRTAITNALHRAGWTNRVRVEVLKSAPEHVGLGSKTTAVLCALRAVASVARKTPDRAEMRILSGRGRTSGVGVHTFFEGSLVVDAGRPRKSRTFDYLPSSCDSMGAVSTRLMSIPMPAHWQVSLALHTKTLGMHDSAELDFFHRNTPTDPQDTLWSLADLYHGLLPAVVEQDLPRLGRALDRFQSRGFKRAEVANQPPPVRALLRKLVQRPGSACGLSSMGPLVFAIHVNGHQPFAGVTMTEFDVLGPFEFQNEGHACQCTGQ